MSVQFLQVSEDVLSLRLEFSVSEILFIYRIQSIKIVPKNTSRLCRFAEDAKPYKLLPVL